MSQENRISYVKKIEALISNRFFMKTSFLPDAWILVFVPFFLLHCITCRSTLRPGLTQATLNITKSKETSNTKTTRRTRNSRRIAQKSHPEETLNGRNVTEDLLHMIDTMQFQPMSKGGEFISVADVRVLISIEFGRRKNGVKNIKTKRQRYIYRVTRRFTLRHCVHETPGSTVNVKLLMETTVTTNFFKCAWIWFHFPCLAGHVTFLVGHLIFLGNVKFETWHVSRFLARSCAPWEKATLFYIVIWQ